MSFEFIRKVLVVRRVQRVQQPNPKRSQLPHAVPPSGLAYVAQEAREDFRRLLPFLCSFPQAPLSCFRQLVKLRASIVLRASPTRADEALLFQFQKSWIERAVIQRENVTAGLLNAPRQPVPVLWSHGLQRPQYHQGQRPL